MNAWDVVLVLCVIVAVALAVRSMQRARRAGGCVSCPFAGSCESRAAGTLSAQKARDLQSPCEALGTTSACEVRHG